MKWNEKSCAVKYSHASVREDTDMTIRGYISYQFIAYPYHFIHLLASKSSLDLPEGTSWGWHLDSLAATKSWELEAFQDCKSRSNESNSSATNCWDFRTCNLSRSLRPSTSRFAVWIPWTTSLVPGMTSRTSSSVTRLLPTSAAASQPHTAASGRTPFDWKYLKITLMNSLLLFGFNPKDCIQLLNSSSLSDSGWSCEAEEGSPWDGKFGRSTELKFFMSAIPDNMGTCWNKLELNLLLSETWV